MTIIRKREKKTLFLGGISSSSSARLKRGMKNEVRTTISKKKNNKGKKVSCGKLRHKEIEKLSSGAHGIEDLENGLEALDGGGFPLYDHIR